MSGITETETCACVSQLLGSVAGCPISIPMTIVMSGISKMFVGELVEIGEIIIHPVWQLNARDLGHA